MQESDSGYHLLFSNPALVEDLMRTFVPEPWVEHLDFSTLQRVNAKLHADNLERREGDIVYRVHYHDGGTVYLYLMLEFQSQPDHWMAVRVGTYVFLLYQHLIKERQITPQSGLAPVFPLVLYNGDQPWPAATQLSDLMPLAKSNRLRAWQPQVGYYLLEERRYPKEAGDSLTGLLFEMENCQDPEQLAAIIGRLDRCLPQPQEAPLRRAFLAWVKHVLVNKKPYAPRVTTLNDLSEVHDMLSTRLDKWIAQAEKQAIERAAAEGHGKGERLILQRQLAKRFGRLPDWALTRLEQATPTELEQWAERILDAVSIEAVFQ